MNERKNELSNDIMLRTRNMRLIENPLFLLVIVEESTIRIVRTIPTYIENGSDAKHDAEFFMKELLMEPCNKLYDGEFLGIIVRKEAYTKMEDKDDVPSIFKNRKAFVISKEIVVEDGEIIRID